MEAQEGKLKNDRVVQVWSFPSSVSISSNVKKLFQGKFHGWECEKIDNFHTSILDNEQREKKKFNETSFLFFARPPPKSWVGESNESIIHILLVQLANTLPSSVSASTKKSYNNGKSFFLLQHLILLHLVNIFSYCTVFCITAESQFQAPPLAGSAHTLKRGEMISSLHFVRARKRRAGAGELREE